MASELASVTIHEASLSDMRTNSIRSELLSIDLRGADQKTVLEHFSVVDLMADLPPYFVDSIDLPELVSYLFIFILFYFILFYFILFYFFDFISYLRRCFCITARDVLEGP
jgi:hypothetical protein